MIDAKQLGRVQLDDIDAIKRAAISHGYKNVNVEYGTMVRDSNGRFIHYYRLSADGVKVSGTAQYLIYVYIADRRF